MTAARFPALLQRFFTERLVTRQGASPHTVAGYRDTFRLLFQFTTARLCRAPSALRLEDLDAAPSWKRSSTTSNGIAVTGRAPATNGSRRSTRSSGTWPSRNRR
jgi:hypothetical protein